MIGRLAVCIVVLAKLLTVAAAQAPTTVITVPSSAPNSNFHDYLCGDHLSQVVDNTIIEINASMNHELPQRQFCVLKNLENITLQSSDDSRMANISCNGMDELSGIGFVGIRNLMLKNIRFENCGGVAQRAKNYEDLAPPDSSPLSAIMDQQQAVLLLSNCTDVTLEGVTIENYRGYAIFATNLYENVTLNSVIVRDSYAFTHGIMSSTKDNLTESGSGIYFYFTDTNAESSSEQNLNSSINILGDTRISRNFNVYPDSYYKKLRTMRIHNQPTNFTLPGAGGLTVIFTQQNFRVSVFAENTTISHNGGTTSGGALVLTRNTINNMDIVFDGCTFLNNSIQDSSSVIGGGGIQLIFTFLFAMLSEVKVTAGMQPSRIEIENSTFQDNRANRGAAIFILNEAQNVDIVKVKLQRVNFTDNDASVEGDCIEARSEDSAYYAPRGINIEMESIKVWHSDGRGSFLDTSYAFTFINVDRVKITGTEQYPTVISNGLNGGVFSFASNIYLSGHIQFTKNQAKYGGALSLHANSYLFFVEQSKVLFSNNRATKFGGALYSDSLSNEQCLMQFIEGMNNYTGDLVREPQDLEDLTADFNITFVDNSAQDGNSIYALPIYNCSWYSESVIQLPNNEIEAVYQTLFYFEAAGGNENETSYLSQTRSFPDKPCFCQNVTEVQLVRFECLYDKENETIDSFPGQSFHIDIVPVDVLGQPLSSIVVSEIVGEFRDEATLKNNRQRSADTLNGNSCTAMNYTLYNMENATVSIQLSIPNTVNAVIVKVNLQECPFGFEMNTITGSCDCDKLFSQVNLEGNAIICNIETLQVTKPFQSWIGPTQLGDNIEPIIGYAFVCPAGYCQTSRIVSFQDMDNSSLQDLICLGDRVGEICGKCPPDLSEKFGTSNCGYCSNYWLFTIFLYALAGIVLVMILFLLKLNISTGALSGMIMYAQFFSINQGLLLQVNETRFATVFISLLNLELGFPICFYYGMTLIGKLGLQFVFPVYLWLLVAAITYFSRYSRLIANLVGSESVKVFVTLIYLSYTKLLRTVFTVFLPNFLQTEDGLHIVWFFDGSMKFFRGQHLALGLLSFAFLVTIIVPYKFSILLAQWCLKSSRISKRYKPLLDANLAPFKDRWRFWFGMRLFIIAILLLFATVLIGLLPILVTFIDLVIILFLLTFQARIQPYKSKVINILDLFFLINFALFLSICLYVLSGTDKEKNIETYYEWIEFIFVGSAFVVFIGIVVYHTIERFKELYRYLEKKRTERRSKVTRTEVSIESSTEDDSIRWIQRSRSGSQQQRAVTITTLQWLERSDTADRLRESLLDD